MAHFIYILYSPGYDQFYVGETSNVEKRLEEHNHKIYKGASTAFTNDWEIFLILECNDIQHARAIESHIKNMKSRQYKSNLKAYPEMRQRLIDRFRHRSAPR